MRIFRFFFLTFLALAAIAALDRPWGAAVPFSIGQFLSPHQGFWRNAEPVDKQYDERLNLPELRQPVRIVFDDRLVPHVFAQNDHDLYFAQGYLHARFRLFQMDLQTRAAAGRVSEIIGEKGIEYDKAQRCLGMVYAAENSLKKVESNDTTRPIFDAYTAGVNAYIESLSPRDWPIEYKLLDGSPAPWDNLRSALLLKMMALTLTGDTKRDIEYSNARGVLSTKDFSTVYPDFPDSLAPIIAKGTPFQRASFRPKPPENTNIIFHQPQTIISKAPESNPNNGSNNWVVAARKTDGKGPILSNDPHLDLTLPSIWFEMQLSSPSTNTYGVSLPGCPFTIIGFSSKIAWGVTNSQRDVLDLYEVQFEDSTRKKYRYNNAWRKTSFRKELIAVKGKPSVKDSVAYTEFGPVIEKIGQGVDTRAISMRWTAHDPSNESLTFFEINRARNLKDFEEALHHYENPGQNFVFASSTGDIAIWQQGKFPAKWAGQGRFLMPGQDSTFQWQGFIPFEENPQMINPAQGYLQSANQHPADAAYAYYAPGNFMDTRALVIERELSKKRKWSIKDMQHLQTNTYNLLAEYLRPVLLKRLDKRRLDDVADKYLNLLTKWDLYAKENSIGQTIFSCFMDSLKTAVWSDELSNVPGNTLIPDDQTLIELILRDPASHFFDNKNTKQVEDLTDVIYEAFLATTRTLSELEDNGMIRWAKFKRPVIPHLLGPSVPFFGSKEIKIGGDNSTINAMGVSHGPSWRMVVQLRKDGPLAFGACPAGQSGNPGSRFYDNGIAKWAKREYNHLKFLNAADINKNNEPWTMTLAP